MILLEKILPVSSVAAATAMALTLPVPLSSAAAADAGNPATCPVFSWTALGTAGGPVPYFDRAEPSNLLQAGDQRILVDAGDGAGNQLARIGISLADVRTIFISHHHLDHTGGLAAVIGLRWMIQAPGRITVYGPPGTVALVDGLIASMAPQANIGFGLGAPPERPASSVEVIELAGGQTVELGGVRVSTAANTHFGAPGEGEAKGAISLSYRFDYGRRSITFTGDTGPSDALVELARGSNLLVSEVVEPEALMADIIANRTFTPQGLREELAKHLSAHHLTAPEVGRLASRSEVGGVLLTHFAIPGPLSASSKAILEGVRTRYSGSVELARDLAVFDVGCS